MNFTFFSSAHRILSRIDHILDHKSSLGKFRKIDIIPSIFSDHNAARLDLNYRRKTIKNPNSMNEILVYARKFGGVRAKAAMVTSAEISHGFVGLRKRASDLGTVIVDESDIKEGLAQGMLLEMLERKR